MARTNLHFREIPIRLGFVLEIPENSHDRAILWSCPQTSAGPRKMDEWSPVEQLIQMDRSLFELINLAWTNVVFDFVFPRITDLHKQSWFLITVVMLLAFWVWRQKTYALKWILVLVLSVGFSDLFAYRAVKKTVARPRPPFAGVQYQLRTNHHSGDSFPSNHAANMFAAATALSGAFPAFAPGFFLIAFMVSYSRVYVGVHFPIDVFVGALIGLMIAAITRRIFRPWLRSGANFSHARN
jgi:undecaprenyl-diphosphatase